MNSPNPILSLTLSLKGLPRIFEANGMTARSYRTTHIARAMMVNIPNDPAGTWKLEPWRLKRLSMEVACSSWNELWLVFMDIIIPVDHIGMTFINALSSSTLSVVHSLHGFKANPSDPISSSRLLIKQALFRNLIKKKIKQKLQRESLTKKKNKKKIKRACFLYNKLC